MSQAANLLMIAMVGLILWTLLISWWLGFRRNKAVKSGEASMEFYTLYQGNGESGALAQHSRHHRNLLELPILFYVMCITIVATGVADMIYAYMGLAFVGSRIIHTFIHMGSNNVVARFSAYSLGLLIMTVMAVRYLIMLL